MVMIENNYYKWKEDETNQTKQQNWKEKMWQMIIIK